MIATMHQRHPTRIGIMLVVLLCTACPDRSQPPEVASAPADAAQARKLADPVARAEIARVEAEHRKDNPAVELAWKDYEVTVTEKPEHYVVFYQYANPDPVFELWAGHGMHFNVYVDRKTGETRMVGGE
jgi:hypothetical protein